MQYQLLEEGAAVVVEGAGVEVLLIFLKHLMVTYLVLSYDYSSVHSMQKSTIFI
jgi:hypothetical protein